MQTIFDKPLDKQVAENTQAIENITDSLLPQKANKFVRFNEVLYHNASTTLTYTGVSVTIPKNCDFAITGFGIYNNTPPQEIAISSSSNSGQTYNFIAYGAISSGIASVSAIGYTEDSPATLYLHMKRAGASGNQDGLKGWYIPRD